METHQNLVLFINEVRRSLLALIIAIGSLTVLLFFLSSGLLTIFQNHLHEKLYFFSVAGPFLSHVKIALFGALYLLMPWIMFVLWKGIGKPFSITGQAVFWFAFSTCILFYGGTLFCYTLTLPYGVDFLLSFQSDALKPVISVSRFVNFVTIFILAFGVIFELPVFMVFAAKIGVPRKTFEKNRRFAVLIIAILAAVLTPTPDVVNMALMGCPLYLLYELGILIIRILKLGEKKKKDTDIEHKDGNLANP